MNIEIWSLITHQGFPSNQYIIPSSLFSIQMLMKDQSRLLLVSLKGKKEEKVQEYGFLKKLLQLPVSKQWQLWTQQEQEQCKLKTRFKNRRRALLASFEKVLIETKKLSFKNKLRSENWRNSNLPTKLIKIYFTKTKCLKKKCDDLITWCRKLQVELTKMAIQLCQSNTMEMHLSSLEICHLPREFWLSQSLKKFMRHFINGMRKKVSTHEKVQKVSFNKEISN